MKKLIAAALCALLLAAVAPVAACSSDVGASSYDIFCIYDEETRTLTGTVQFSYLNDTDDEISDLKFNLYGNAFREGAQYAPVSSSYSAKAYYDGASYGGMTVESVEGCAGWEIGGEDENILTVTLPSSVYPDERAIVTISYTLTLAKVNHRTGVTEKCVNLGNFYPILCARDENGYIEAPYYSVGDPFVSDCADYTVTLDMPAGYTAATSGQLQSDSVVSGRRKCVYSLERARDFAAVMSAHFSTVSAEADGKQITYYYYDDDSPQTALNAARESLTYFSESFGEYVYPTLSVVQTGFCYGGMEYPALTMISDSLDSDERAYTVVHENAHQWWYAMVGSNQIECGWQDEGLAEYSTLMFFESYPAYGFTRTGLTGTATKAYRAFFTVYGQIFGDADTTMTRSLSTFVSDYEYANIAYNKGLIMFETLRKSIGDEAFLKGLKSYYAADLYSIASPDDLIGSFAASHDVEGLFTSFIEGKIVI